MNRAPIQPTILPPLQDRGIRCPACGVTRAVSGDHYACVRPDCPCRTPVWLMEAANVQCERRVPA